MRYSGKIGYGITSESETAPGVWKVNDYTEKDAIGDYEKNINRNESSNKVNNDISISNVISIVSDPYSRANFRFIKYAIIDGVKWAVTSVEVRYPRLVLTLGGVYNA